MRDVTPPSQRERQLLEPEHELNPLAGTRLRRRLRTFRPEADTYLASLGGPTPYMQRLRQIEVETQEHLDRLATAHAGHRADPDGWRRDVGRWDFGAVNDLIERHNRWYPLEARLAMDPRTRDFVHVGGKPYQRDLLTAAWVLERFPVGE